MLVAICAVAPCVAARPLRRCAPRRAHVIVASDRAQVYRANSKYGVPEVFGCLRSGGRARWLGEAFTESSQGDTGIERETLAGTFVAFGEESTQNLGERTSASFHVAVVDLRTGRLVHRAPTGTPERAYEGEIGLGPVVDLLLTPRGSVAWIAEGWNAHPATYEIHALDPRGNRVLASGGDVDPSSLARVGARITWSQAGVPASAPFG